MDDGRTEMLARSCSVDEYNFLVFSFTRIVFVVTQVKMLQH